MRQQFTLRTDGEPSICELVRRAREGPRRRGKPLWTKSPHLATPQPTGQRKGHHVNWRPLRTDGLAPFRRLKGRIGHAARWVWRASVVEGAAIGAGEQVPVDDPAPGPDHELLPRQLYLKQR